MRLPIALALGSAALLAGAPAAFAGPLTAAEILRQYNTVIYGNAGTFADIEGAAVIGGNFSGATVYNVPAHAQPAAGALTVYGNTSGNPINIDNGGNAYVGGNRGAIVNFNGGGGYLGASPYVIDDFRTPLNALSAALAALDATAAMPAPDNNVVIRAMPGSDGIAVFDLTAAQLAAFPSFSVDLNGAESVIFNVSGSSATFQANEQNPTSGANDIIWNFHEATGQVSFNTQIGGSVLAPYASVRNNNQIDGFLVAQSWTGQGELHDWPFTGRLPGGGASAVPEPGSVILLTGALALLALTGTPGRAIRIRQHRRADPGA